MTKKNCKHTNVIFVSKITRYIPEGWEELEAKEDVDLEDYETSGKYFAVVCEDCGEILDENIF